MMIASPSPRASAELAAWRAGTVRCSCGNRESREVRERLLVGTMGRETRTRREARGLTGVIGGLRCGEWLLQARPGRRRPGDTSVDNAHRHGWRSGAPSRPKTAALTPATRLAGLRQPAHTRCGAGARAATPVFDQAEWRSLRNQLPDRQRSVFRHRPGD